MAKVAKLVAVSFIARVVVDEDASLETIYEKAKESVLNQIENGDLPSNVEDIFEDKECPYGSMKKDLG